jgi:hypothetical protein
MWFETSIDQWHCGLATVQESVSGPALVVGETSRLLKIFSCPAFLRARPLFAASILLVEKQSRHLRRRQTSRDMT